MTPPEEQVLKSKICCACNKEKEITSFYKNAMMPSGWEARCKTCRYEGCKCRKTKSYERSKNLTSGRPKSNAPQLWNVRKKDWIETFEFLKSMGYDLSKNIHEQFCERHNLKPRKRMKEKSIQYTPQDLGLI